MHPESFARMARELKRTPGQNVLDVGAYDVNGSYRPICEALGKSYTGLDIVAGPNVDIVAADPYRYQIPDGSFDIVISGQAMEHVEQPWRWVPELARVLKPGGTLIIITHHNYPEHRYPVDCWRILPDGMRVLFDIAGVLCDYQIEMFNKHDIIGRATRCPSA